MKKDLSEERLIWLVAMFHFLRLVNGRRNRNNAHPHLVLVCAPRDQHSGCKWKERGCKSGHHKSQARVFSFNNQQAARASGTCTYTYVHASFGTSFFFFPGLCSHQCVQLDREREDGRNSWGSEVVQLSNYKLWGPRIFHDCISAASGVHQGGSMASPGKRPGGGRWWFAILMDGPSSHIAPGFGGPVDPSYTSGS